MKKILRIALILVLLASIGFAVMIATEYDTMVPVKVEEAEASLVSLEEIEETGTPEVDESTDQSDETSTEIEVTEPEVEVEESIQPEEVPTEPEDELIEEIALGDKIFGLLGLSNLVETHGVDKIVTINIYLAVVLALITGMLLPGCFPTKNKKPVFRKHKKYSKEFKAAAKGQKLDKNSKHTIRF